MSASARLSGRARKLRWGVIAALPMLLSACPASRQDIAVLQNDLRIMRTEAAMADSAHRAELARMAAIVRAVDDSMRVVTRNASKFQGDVLGNLFSMNQQLLQIQELTGQSQRRMQELRAELEQRNQALPTPPAVVPESAMTMTSPLPGAPATPGPNQLLQLALGQLRRGASGAARAGFQDLLRQYPTAEVAGDAQFHIAESYTLEGKGAPADSAYVLVYTKYPDSPKAATALYKHALGLQAAGKTQQARDAFNLVIKKYPRSDEALLAPDRLRALK